MRYELGDDGRPSSNSSNCVQMRVDPNLTPQGSKFADAELVRDMADVTRAANRANATLYTIDPRGLVAGGDIGENVDPGRVGNLRLAKRRTACARSRI